MFSKKRKITSKNYIEQFVYGATDGAITTFAVVAGSAGAGFSNTIALTLGIANLFADGFSMGVSAYLSFMAEPKPNRSWSIKRALVTFGSFILVGSLPLIAYILAEVVSPDADSTFIRSAVVTMIAFAFIGSVKARATGTSYAKSIFSTVAIGSIAAGISFYIGYFVEKLIS
jgi:VIT1/CCC1 family predicted Fe2+/Mn2+ transporter